MGMGNLVSRGNLELVFDNQTDKPVSVYVIQVEPPAAPAADSAAKGADAKAGQKEGATSSSWLTSITGEAEPPGKETLVGTVKPKEKLTETTAAGDRWVVKDASGAVLNKYKADDKTKQEVAITGKKTFCCC